MRQLLFLAVALVGCGDGGSSANPDAATPDPDAPTTYDFTPGCSDIPQPSPNIFMTAAELGPILPGSLASWDPAGRWFMTGTRMRGLPPFGSTQSVHFTRKSPTQVTIDRNDQSIATIDNDVLYQRLTFQVEDKTFILARRVSNLLPDNSLRADRAICDGTTCRVCTAKLVRAEHHDPLPAENLALVGQLKGDDWGPGFTFNVRVVGNTAYLVRIDGLYIIDVTDPANPTQLSHWRRTGDGYSNDVKIVSTATKRYAIIADIPVDVVDVTDPTNPTLAAQIPEEAHTVFTETRNNLTYAYFGNYDGTTPVFDVTNPATPVRLGRYNANASNVHDLSVKDGIAYLNAWEQGLLMVDFTNPATPLLRGSWKPTPAESSHSNWTTTVGNRKIALHGDEAYGAHLDVVDIDPISPTFMQPIGTYKTRDWVSIHNIMAFGSKAYFTYYQDGVRVLDLSDPTQPALIGYYNTWDPQADYTSNAFFEGAVGLDVDLARKLIFVADSPRGLLILQDNTP